MSAIDDRIEFHCACGKAYRVKSELAGRRFRCSQCKQPMTVPSDTGVDTQNVADRPSPSTTPAVRPTAMPETVEGRVTSVRDDRSLRVPSSIKELLTYLVAGWGCIGLVALVVSLFSTYAAVVALLTFVAATGVSLHQTWLILNARQRVLSRKQVPLLYGLVHLIAWDPTEGVLVLRNKGVFFSDDDLHDGRGGVRFLYPVLGEELALRVPLEVQTLRFEDDNVLTREYLSLMIRGTMKWRITDINRFYLLVSRELRQTSDAGGRVRSTPTTKDEPTGDPSPPDTIELLVRSAIEWLRVLAEEQTRLVVSRIGSGLLIADRLAGEVPEVKGARGTGSEEFGGATAGLAEKIFTTLAQRVAEFGISIHDVSLQEIKLPEEIVQQCIAACKAAYLPTIAERQSAAKRANLKVEVDLLGREVVGTRQIVEAAPAYALPEFINDFLRANMPVMAGAAIGSAAATRLADAEADRALPKA